MSLSYIGQQITIYSCFFLLIAGLIGNGINILVFSSVRSYRTTPCTFYFLIASIYNIHAILIILPSRIAMSGYGVDLTRTSVSWCKVRQFISAVLALTSLTCSCLATIDQFFATSRRASVRRLSNIKLAHRIVIIVMIVWILHAIPMLVFYDISPTTKSCVNTNYTYIIYYPVYLIGFLCVIPCLVLIVFGYLAYQNIQQTRVLAEQQADRQLIRMIFVETALALISYAPYGIIGTYNLMTSNISKDTNRLSIEGFVTTLIGTTGFIYYAGSCYMFLISSSHFRRAAKSRIFLCLRLNYVTPIQVPNDGAIILQNKARNRSKT